MKEKRDFPHSLLSLASTTNVSHNVAFVGPSMLAEGVSAVCDSFPGT